MPPFSKKHSLCSSLVAALMRVLPTHRAEGRQPPPNQGSKG